MKVVALAGGVGGAKLADGLALALPPGDLTVIVNTGDDFRHFGLWVCPDVDTVCYTLAGLANPMTGWGRKDDTSHVMEALQALGGPSWFHLGDRDLSTHLERTRRLGQGDSLTAITRDFCRTWGVETPVLPMSDDTVQTWVDTEEGELPFQEYFVRRQCAPHVKGFWFEGVEKAQPAPGAIEAIDSAELVVICPSNPWVSIAPILSVPGIKGSLKSKKVLAVSPIIAGQAVKGPAAKMYAELGIEPSALAVARQYGGQGTGGLLTGFVLDQQDESQSAGVQALGIEVLATDTLMKSPADRLRLAQEVLNFGTILDA
jgi:LPPG:FO 2-phospho-L-lactate transferase